MMTWGGKMMVLKAGYFLYQSIERLSLRVIIELQMTALPTADGNSLLQKSWDTIYSSISVFLSCLGPDHLHLLIATLIHLNHIMIIENLPNFQTFKVFL